MTYMEWFTLGLLLVLLELFVPGVFLIWFGLAAFASGVVAIYFEPTFIEQALIFCGFSAVFLLLGWLIYGKLTGRNMPEEYRHLNDPAGAFVGKTFILIEDEADGRSKAKVGDTVWIIKCKDGAKKGDKVKITGVIDGVILKGEDVTDK